MNRFFVKIANDDRESYYCSKMTKAIVMMVICLIAMSVSAYAYFKHDATSKNVFYAASFDVDIKATYTDDQGVFKEAQIHTPGNMGLFTHIIDNIEPNVEYDITLTYMGNADTGFCYIIAENGEQYITRQLGFDASDPQSFCSQISFKLKVNSERPTFVKIVASWGTSVNYVDPSNSINYIVDGSVVDITINNNTQTNGNGSESSSDGEITSAETTVSGETSSAITE